MYRSRHPLTPRSLINNELWVQSVDFCLLTAYKSMAPRRVAAPTLEPKKRIAVNGERLPDPIPEGELFKDTAQNVWRLGHSIGLGGFGEIYLGNVIVCQVLKYGEVSPIQSLLIRMSLKNCKLRYFTVYFLYRTQHCLPHSTLFCLQKYFYQKLVYLVLGYIWREEKAQLWVGNNRLPNT